MSSLSTRAASLAPRTVEVTFKDTAAPETSGDILALFESNSGVKSETSNEWIVDVFPDFMVIITYVMLIVRRFSLADDARIHPKVSTPTVAMYYVSLIYGFLLTSDCYLRSTPSVYARLWKESSWRHDFMTFLMTLPVPEDLEPIIAQLTSTETERSRNVSFIPSAAGFSLRHFFGRYLPIDFFTILHDSASSLPGNSSKSAVMAHVLSQLTFSIAQASPAVNVTMLMADFLGYSIDQTTSTTANYINSKFHQVFTAVFNPVLFRDYQRRSSLAEIGLFPPTFKTEEPNAYDILFSATAPNLAELKVVLQTVSSFLKGNVKCKNTLGQLLSAPSGNLILSHGYAELPLPITSYNKNHSSDAFSKITTLSRVPFENRAADFSFLDLATTPAAAATDIYDVKYEDTAGTHTAIPAGHQISKFWPFSLLSNTAATSAWPNRTAASSDFVLFKPERHIHPRVLLLDIQNDLKSASAVPLLAGKLIYSYELDGTTIEIPNIDKALGMQNVLFADSAIPYEYVRFATKYYPRTKGSLVPPRPRATANSTRSLPASSLLHDRTIISLPEIDADRFTPSTSSTEIIDASVPSTLPGFTKLAHVEWLRHAQSFLGFKVTDPSGLRPTTKSVPGMEKGRLMVWSAYTVNTYVDSDDVTPDYKASHHYFLTNLRTLFGTDFNLVEMQHPFEALPVS